VFALGGALLLPACTGSPTSSTPPPVDPGAPAISCPASPATVQSPDGLAVTIAYGMPTVSGGSLPLSGPTCTPASGTGFPVGSTTVTCTVTDAKARTNSCTFGVTVQSPPRLSLTRFLAFGDSMTAGEIVSEGLRPLLVDPVLAYPADLIRDLTIRYRTQQPFVVNEGIPAETTVQGALRISGTIARGNNYQVLLLMEGANDIPNGTLAIVPAANNIQLMIRAGKAAGLKVYLGTLPPENPNACTGSAAFPGCIARNRGAPFVVPYNDVMKLVAAAESVPLVDVYAAFKGDVTTLIDFDGLHPTANGYQTIADAFFESIKQTLELPAAVQTTLTRPFFAAPRRR
jgi:lysophospholipase L1-like esterase